MATQMVPFGRGDVERLVDFLCSQRWPYHVIDRPRPADVRARAEAGTWDGGGIATFWVRRDDEDLGLVRLEDLDDDTPLFDLRVHQAHRRQGVGRAALAWLTRHVFTSFPHITRIEGNTREDNVAMRRLFERSGWVKEAHHREAWRAADRRHDSIGYAVLRRDWEHGTVTPVRWAD